MLKIFITIFFCLHIKIFKIDFYEHFHFVLMKIASAFSNEANWIQNNTLGLGCIVSITKSHFG